MSFLIKKPDCLQERDFVSAKLFRTQTTKLSKQVFNQTKDQIFSYDQ
jgi:hypothetical protein